MTRSPLAARRQLGAALRDLRLEAKMTLDDAAHTLECSTAKVSRLETGKGKPRARDVRDLLALYRLGDESARAELMRLTEDSVSKDAGLISDFRDVVEGNADAARYAALEQDASAIQSYETNLVPGLLQTRAYASAVADLILPDLSVGQRQRFVDFRMERQKVLRREQSLRLAVVLGESALRRPIGGPDVMREQLDELARSLRNGLGSVEFHIAPLDLVNPIVIGGSFVVITFDDDRDQDVVYLEGPTSAVYLETDDDVNQYQQSFATLVEACPPKEESLDIVEHAYAKLT